MTFLPDDSAQSNNIEDFFAVQQNIHEYGTLSLQKGIAQWATGKWDDLLPKFAIIFPVSAQPTPTPLAGCNLSPKMCESQL